MIAQDSRTLGSFQELVTMLEDMVRPLEQPQIKQPTWESVINILQEMEQGFFASSSGPDGSPWAPNRPYTQQKKGHGIILRETFELENSLTKTSATSIRNIQPTSLDFGTNRPWAWIHQEGAGKIPQRMFIGMTEDSLTDVLDVVADAAVQMMFGE